MRIHKCCQKCEKRYPKCHADCPEKAAEDAALQEMKQKKAKENPCMEYQVAKKEKVIKKARHYHK